MSVMVLTAAIQWVPAITWAMPIENLGASTRRWRCTEALLISAVHFRKMISFRVWYFWGLARPHLQRARSGSPGRIFKLGFSGWVELRGRHFIRALMPWKNWRGWREGQKVKRGQDGGEAGYEW